MRSTKCMFSTASALRRVFLAPIERPQSLSLQPPNLRLHLPPRHAIASHTYHTDATATKSRLPRDHEIKSRYVCIKQPGGHISEPMQTSYLLSTFDLKTHSMVMLTEAVPGTSPPIVHIIDKKALWVSEKEADKKSRKAKANNKAGKVLELNWNISVGDMAHRMKRMKEFLGKGLKVDVLLARKRKGGSKSHVPDVPECEKLIERIKEAAKEVEGVKEYKTMEGAVPRIEPRKVYAPGEERPPPEKVKRGEVKLFFQGKVVKVAKKGKDGKEVEEVEEEEEQDEEDGEGDDDADGKEVDVEEEFEKAKVV